MPDKTEQLPPKQTKDQQKKAEAVLNAQVLKTELQQGYRDTVTPQK